MSDTSLINEPTVTVVSIERPEKWFCKSILVTVLLSVVLPIFLVLTGIIWEGHLKHFSIMGVLISVSYALFSIKLIEEKVKIRRKQGVSFHE